MPHTQNKGYPFRELWKRVRSIQFHSPPFSQYATHSDTDSTRQGPLLGDADRLSCQRLLSSTTNCNFSVDDVKPHADGFAVCLISIRCAESLIPSFSRIRVRLPFSLQVELSACIQRIKCRSRLIFAAFRRVSIPTARIGESSMPADQHSRLGDY